MHRRLIPMLLLLPFAVPAPALEVGFAEVEITPALEEDKPVWLAGYGPGRKAEGVHDPLMARCMVLRDGEDSVAIISVDLVGLQLREARAIRARLPKIGRVVVSSTHNHEGPDVIGIWGPTFVQRGVDEDYLQQVVDRVVEGVKRAAASVTSCVARFGTASDESLVSDSRLPIVKDAALRVLRFDPLPAEGEAVRRAAPLGLLVQWNSHPESLGRRNRLITADFPYATVAALKEKYNCEVVYVTGAVGGLMAPPGDDVRDAEGNLLREGTFEYAEGHGRNVAALAVRAIERAEPIRLTPFAGHTQPIAVPVDNLYYKAARQLGVLRREGRVWTGDPLRLGEAEPEVPPGTPEENRPRLAMESEVTYLRLGELGIACIPGEIYPELVYGRFEDPADPNADFPEAPLEASVEELVPTKNWMLFGLANDEIGYLIPKRQWDHEPPFCYGRTKSQYGEVNSCGPDAAASVMAGFRRCVEKVGREK